MAQVHFSKANEHIISREAKQILKCNDIYHTIYILRFERHFISNFDKQIVIFRHRVTMRHK